MSDKELELELRLMKQQLADIVPKVNAMHDKILSVQWCPKPALCLTLEALQADHEQRLRLLEKRAWQLVGATSVATGLISMLGSYLLRHFVG